MSTFFILPPYLQSMLGTALVSNFTGNILLDPGLADVSHDMAVTAEANANFVTVEAAGLSPEQEASRKAQSAVQGL